MKLADLQALVNQAVEHGHGDLTVWILADGHGWPASSCSIGGSGAGRFFYIDQDGDQEPLEL